MRLQKLLAAATPTPWDCPENPVISGPKSECIARMMQGGGRMVSLNEAAANLRLIIHCVNNFAQTVKGLESAAKMLADRIHEEEDKGTFSEEDSEKWEEIREALAAAQTIQTR